MQTNNLRMILNCALLIVNTIKTKNYDDLNSYIPAIAVLFSAWKTSDSAAVSHTADYADRLDSGSNLGCNIASEFQSGQKKCKTY